MLTISNLKRFNVQISDIQSFCTRHYILKLTLYGSVLGNDFNDKSDIDLLAEFDPTHIPSLFQMVRMEKELSVLFGDRKIDLRTADDLSRYFRNDVISKGRIIYAR
jgi:predicted nucleotidyltransferase